jgi:hypothetical protein
MHPEAELDGDFGAAICSRLHAIANARRPDFVV